MDWILQPAFFRQLDAYQSVTSHEQREKPVWNAMRILLMWAWSPNHQQIGREVPVSTISDSLQHYFLDKNIPIPESIQIFISDPIPVMEALETNNYGTYKHLREGQELTPALHTFRFNDFGFLTGKVLTSTQTIRGKAFYFLSSKLWWMFFLLGWVVALATLYLSRIPVH